MATVGALEIEIAANVARLTKDLRAIRKQLKGVGKSAKTSAVSLRQLQKAALGYIAVVGGLRSVRKAFDLAFDAAQFNQAEVAFENLAASHGADSAEIIENLRAVSAQTISTADLMKSAGTAMILGIPADKLADLMKIARNSARITGQSMEAAFSDISRGIGRQSKLILDNLGIIVSIGKANKNYAKAMEITGRELTDVEKKQAFLNETIMAGEDIIKRVGADSLTSAEKLQRFKAQLEDIAITIGERLIPVIEPLLDIFANLLPAREIEGPLTRIRDLRLALIDLEKVRVGLSGEVARGSSLVANTQLLKENALAIELVKFQLMDIILPYTAMRTVQEKVNEETEKLTAKQLSFEKKILDVVISIEKLTASKERLLELDILAFSMGEASIDQIERFRQALEELRDLQAIDIEFKRGEEEENLMFKQAKERMRIEKGVEDFIVQTRRNTVSQSIGLLQILGNKSKSLAIAAIAFEKGVAIARVIINTQAAIMAAQAVDPTGILATKAKIMGTLAVATIAATGIAQAASIGGGADTVTGGIGGGGFETTGAIPSIEQRGVQQINVSVFALDPSNVNWDRLTEDNIVPALERLSGTQGRNVELDIKVLS